MKALLLLMWFWGVMQTPRLRWVDFHPPQYPQMARVANIDGPVTVKFVFGANGSIEVKESSGHPILVQAAIESLKASKLVCDGCGQNEPEFSVVFDFKFAGEESQNSELNNSSGAALDSPNHVTIITTVFTERLAITDPRGIVTKRVRSVRCLYLWKCATRRD